PGGLTDRHAVRGVPAPDAAPSPICAAPGLHLYGTEADRVLECAGAGIQLGMGLTEAMVRYAVRHEYAQTVEDVLARRWRVLFLDARLASQLAPAVAALVHEETGADAQLDAFMALTVQYLHVPA